ncbi:DUF433 domain-containing protein [candidate division WOR-3 bacterium]|nr:DUF433 domain-containing protein [candidate division WOR-3 bacterium]MCK4526537.1 DUF433 domain-containing protein [candidate division WOR-3 bacterium]
MEARDRIIIDPKVMGGKPVIKGTRVPVEIIIGSFAGGMPNEEIKKEYGITEEDIKAAFTYAAEVLSQEKVYEISTG